jgi:hypothetical protein
MRLIFIRQSSWCNRNLAPSQIDYHLTEAVPLSSMFHYRRRYQKIAQSAQLFGALQGFHLLAQSSQQQSDRQFRSLMGEHGDARGSD